MVPKTDNAAARTEIQVQIPTGWQIPERLM
jgi:hypothetical protein